MLDELLCAVRLAPGNVMPGERPDFVLEISGQRIGVEITTYQSGAELGKGHSRRQAEAEWECLRLAARDFLLANSDLRNVHVYLTFKNTVPARRNHQRFINEIAAFIRERANGIKVAGAIFGIRDFVSLLMKTHLQSLRLRITDFAEWNSNFDAGWVTWPGQTLENIIAEKADEAAKYVSKYHELWLIIYSSHRISETVLPLKGMADLNAISVWGGPFTKIYLLTMHGNFRWGRLSAWERLPLSRRLAGGEGDFGSLPK